MRVNRSFTCLCLALLTVIFLPSFSFTSDTGTNGCYTIVAGRLAGSGGAVMVAHNEECFNGNFYTEVHTVPAARHHRGQVLKLKKGGILPQVSRTYSLFWLQVPGIDFSDTYVNSRGVLVTSNACLSREKTSRLYNGGIGFMLRRIVSERASSAKEGVEIAGQLIDKYGYYDSGRSYTIADKKEAWILQVVKGKHWVAQRVPDNHVAVIPNCFTIGKVNLEDTGNFLGSSDLVDYAAVRGWYNPEKDGAFNFANAYALKGTIGSESNVLRRWRGLNLLARKKQPPDAPLPFSFQPRKGGLHLRDFYRVLRDHYEDTKFDETDGYRNGSPNYSKKPAICSHAVRYSFVAELRNELPAAISNRMWISFAGPDSNAFIPWYTSMPLPPDGYNRRKSSNALETHFSSAKHYYGKNGTYAYQTYARLSKLVDKDYRSRIRMARKEWHNYEEYTTKRLRKREKEFLYLLETNKHVAQKIITNYLHQLEYRRWFLAAKLVQQIEN